MDNFSLYEFSAWVIPVLIAITFHEASHGFVARRCSDNTAYNEGRVTFNPFKHIDPIGTIVLPLLLFFSQSPFIFGYAKPVPVNFSGLNNPRWDSLKVAIAGPAINIVLAIISALLLHIENFVPREQADWLFQALYVSLHINAVLAIFNMLPLLPLDGGRVLQSLLSPPLAARYGQTERYGLAVVMLLFIVPALLGETAGISFNPANTLILKPTMFVVKIIMQLTGNTL